MLIELFVRRYFQQNELLLNIFSFLLHKIIVLISNIVIYSKVGHSKFVEMHVDASDFYRSTLVIYTRQQDNITIYRTVNLHVYRHVQTLMHMQLRNKLWTTVALFHFWNLIWGLTNNNYSLYFLQFLTDSVNTCIYVCAIFSFSTLQLNRWANWQRHLSSAEDYTYMNYYNLCGIRSQHSTISKGGEKKGVHIKKLLLWKTLE
jgi:hypothetical protein